MSDKVDSFYEMELKPQLEGYLSKEIMSKIDYAFVFAREAHKDQYRSSGEPFILHPLNVAKILAEHHASADIIITALLHDVILSVGFCGAMGIEIDIPVIAALLTLYGYSVNDTIVVFDRIRETNELKGKLIFSEVVNKAITQRRLPV